MKKSIQSVFLALMFLTVLSSGCGAASTPILPTFTPSPIPPTSTPEPTATATPVATDTLSPGIGSTRERPGDKMVMVYVPEGKFTMGSNDAGSEYPVHIVYLSGYWIDQTEVTNGMYALCVQAGVCQPPSDSSSSTRTSYYGNSQYADFPVIYVDWNDAQAYCSWSGARLPTEAEWEKAARGTDARTYPWGNTAPSTNLLNFNKNVGDTTAVGNYPSGASPYGALDMAGNVLEWVADWFSDIYYYSSPSSNPTGPDSGTSRVWRSSSWNLDENYVRSAYRNGYKPYYSFNVLGFRCVLSP